MAAHLIFILGNVLKEICEPAGAVIHVDKFELGDPTLSLLEIWGAEYQESDAMLIKEKDTSLLKKIAEREKVPVCFVGDITGEYCLLLLIRTSKVMKLLSHLNPNIINSC